MTPFNLFANSSSVNPAPFGGASNMHFGHPGRKKKSASEGFSVLNSFDFSKKSAMCT